MQPAAVGIEPLLFIIGSYWVESEDASPFPDTTHLPTPPARADLLSDILTISKGFHDNPPLLSYVCVCSVCGMSVTVSLCVCVCVSDNCVFHMCNQVYVCFSIGCVSVPLLACQVSLLSLYWS